MCGNKGNIGNDKTKINCQCDGNCNCGEILPNGKISCDNCGWKAPEAYNTITGNHVCPSCRTESSFNSNNNNHLNNKKMNNRENFSKGLVGFATANPGFLNWSDNAIGKPNPNGSNESGFSKGLVGFANANPGFLNWSEEPLGGRNESGFSQQVMGYATGIGQGFMLDPFSRGRESGFAGDGLSKQVQKFATGNQGFMLGESGFGEGLSDEDKQWAMAFYQNSDIATEDGGGEESGTFKSWWQQNVKPNYGSFHSIIDPSFVLRRAIWSRNYCKSLGYARKGEGNAAFQRCVAATKVHFADAKRGSWKYPTAPEGAIANLTPEQIAAESEKEIASMPDAVKNNTVNSDITDSQRQPLPTDTAPKSNMMMYVIIGVVVLAIIIAIIIMMRKRATPAA